VGTEGHELKNPGITHTPENRSGSFVGVKLYALLGGGTRPSPALKGRKTLAQALALNVTHIFFGVTFVPLGRKQQAFEKVVRRAGSGAA
jgi:hypothetical protein